MCKSSATVIHEEIFAYIRTWKPELWFAGTKRRRIIKIAASNGTTLRGAGKVHISKDWTGETGRWRLDRAFVGRPAIICTFLAVVDFLPGASTDVIDEHSASAALKGKCKRISQAEEVDRAIYSRGRIVDRAIGGMVDAGTVPSGFPAPDYPRRFS
jgi:hypothetical protein